MAVYAELQVTTNFSFLEGASHPEELVRTAAALGHQAVAITDRNTLAGIVRAHVAARETGIRLVIGARLDLADGPSLLCYPTDRAAYGRLCRLLTVGRRRAPKGQCHLTRADLDAHAEGQILIALPPADATDGSFPAALRAYRDRFGHRLHLAVHQHHRGDDARRLRWLADLAGIVRVPLVATNDVLYHEPGRRALQDVLTCVREHCTLPEAGYRLAANAERHLKHGPEMARIFRDHPEALARTVEIVGQCRFSLDDLVYEYPDEVAEGAASPQERLEQLTALGAAERYPDGVPAKVATALRHELDLIRELGFAPFFLTVHDVVRFARERGILCQGRGSAANSAVCYVLGVTNVDPAKFDLLFERFLSAARNQPPDIDVDFEHERREEVIQYVYRTYGRDRAALAATVIRYRARSALLDVGKALGLSRDTIRAISGNTWGWGGHDALEDDRVREVGLDPSDRTLRLALDLAGQLIGFPRHLSQHVGGFVITRGRLDEIVPVENAAMADRTVIEWDKDDIDALNILKVDCLALGMLSCLRRGLDLVERHYGIRHTLASIPPDDAETYAMLSRGDSLGVFQVESRAQMAMLPRLRPTCFYDLVIEVAIVRPGPIVGDMVHPYLRRRNKEEPLDTLPPDLEPVLGRTLGVPIFQEQVMKVAMVAGGFSAEEADRLRRSMATFKQAGDLAPFQTMLRARMVARGYDRDFAERCCKQLEGFGSYGFPESHAAAFAHLVYVSAWAKRHYPEVFACALLNSQPMGFYAPAQIIRDARDHGVAVRPVDVNHSHWDCTLEPTGGGRHALRLGLRLVDKLAAAEAARLVVCREQGYGGVRDLWHRAGLKPATMMLLAAADAFRSTGADRRRAVWEAEALDTALPLFAGLAADRPEAPVNLPAMTTGEHVVADYRSTALSLKAHPIGLLRAVLDARACVRATDLASLRPGSRIRVAGLVLVRQQPGTAKGTIFVTVEDETGVANLVIWQHVFQKFRRQVLRAQLLMARGRLEREREVIHVVVDEIEDWSALLDGLQRVDRPDAFRAIPTRADEVRRPQHGRRKEAEVTVKSRDFR